MRNEGSVRTTQARSPALHNRLAYGLGDAGFLILWQSGALFILYFYTVVLGLPGWLAGAIFLTAMVSDAVSDPLIAAWAERRAARTGRYSPIIAWAALPAGASFTLMFTDPFNGVALSAGWALLTHLAFRTAFTFASMPYNTLPLRLTRDTNARSALSAVRVAGAAIGGLGAAVAMPLLVEAGGYTIAAVVAGGVAALLLVTCSAGSGETRAVTPHQPDRPFAHDLAGLWTGVRGNPPVQRLLGVMAAGTIGYGFFTYAAVFYMQHVVVRPDLIPAALGLPALTTIIGAPIWMVVAARTSKRLSMMAGITVAVTGYLLLWPAASGNIALLLAGVAIAGLGGAAIPVMLWSMMPDAIEHGEVERGTRIEARTFGLTTFVQKTAAGAVALAAGIVLSASGFSPDGDLATGAAWTITAMVSVFPAIFMVLIILVIRTYPIDRLRHAEIVTALERPESRPRKK